MPKWTALEHPGSGAAVDADTLAIGDEAVASGVPPALLQLVSCDRLLRCCAGARSSPQGGSQGHAGYVPARCRRVVEFSKAYAEQTSANTGLWATTVESGCITRDGTAKR